MRTVCGPRTLTASEATVAPPEVIKRLVLNMGGEEVRKVRDDRKKGPKWGKA